MLEQTAVRGAEQKGLRYDPDEGETVLSTADHRNLCGFAAVMLFRSRSPKEVPVHRAVSNSLSRHHLGVDMVNIVPKQSISWGMRAGTRNSGLSQQTSFHFFNSWAKKGFLRLSHLLPL